MQNEVEYFERNKVWELVPRPNCLKIIDTKWTFMNKCDDHGHVTRNKAQLVAEGYNQVEGVDFDETFGPIACLESTRLLFGISCHLYLKHYKMDVKSTFLKGYLNEKAFAKHPKGFVDLSS